MLLFDDGCAQVQSYQISSLPIDTDAFEDGEHEPGCDAPRPPPGLYDLYDDLWLASAGFLGAVDLLNLSASCRRLRDLVRSSPAPWEAACGTWDGMFPIALLCTKGLFCSLPTSISQVGAGRLRAFASIFSVGCLGSDCDNVP